MLCLLYNTFTFILYILLFLLNKPSLKRYIHTYIHPADVPADVNLSLDELVKQVLCDEPRSSRGAYNTEYVSLSVSSIAESESPVYHKMQPPSAQRINQLPRVSPRNYTPKIQPPPSSKSPAKKQVRKGKKGPLANTKRKQSSKNNRQVCARCQTTHNSPKDRTLFEKDPNHNKWVGCKNEKH